MALTPLQVAIKRVYPEEDVSILKPFVHNGNNYFPAHVMCRIAKKAFNDFASTKRNKRLVQLLAQKLDTANSVSESDPSSPPQVLVSNKQTGFPIASFPKGSFIHQKLVFHFLVWCDVEFAIDATEIFERFCSGDASLVPEIAANRTMAHDAELQALKDDAELKLAAVEKQAEQLRQDQDTLLKVAAATGALLQQRLSEIEALKTDVELLKADKEKYALVLENRQKRVEQLESDLEDSADEKRHLEHVIDRDSGRPLNVFKRARTSGTISMSTVNRNNTFTFWFPARHITTDVAIYLARKNFMQFAKRVTAAFMGSETFLTDAAVAACVANLESGNHRQYKNERKLVMTKYYELEQDVATKICNDIVRSTVNAVHDIFRVSLPVHAMDVHVVLNNVTLYQRICKELRSIYQVQYSTEIDAKYLARMAHNFNKYTDYDFVIPLDEDFIEAIGGDDDVQLLC